MAAYSKLPGATLAVVADFTGALYEGDEILTASATAYDETAAQLVTGTFLSGSPGVDGLVVSVTTVDGTAGHRYVVTVGVTTDHGLVTKDVIVHVLSRAPWPWGDPDRPYVWELLTEAEQYVGLYTLGVQGAVFFDEWILALEDAVADGHAPADVFSRARDLDSLIQPGARTYFTHHQAYRVRMAVKAIEEGNAAAVATINAYVLNPPPPFEG